MFYDFCNRNLTSVYYTNLERKFHLIKAGDKIRCGRCKRVYDRIVFSNKHNCPVECTFGAFYIIESEWQNPRTSNFRLQSFQNQKCEQFLF